MDLRGFNGSNISGCSTHATGYLLRKIDLTIVLYYCIIFCVLMVIFFTFTLGFEGVVMNL